MLAPRERKPRIQAVCSSCREEERVREALDGCEFLSVTNWPRGFVEIDLPIEKLFQSSIFVYSQSVFLAELLR